MQELKKTENWLCWNRKMNQDGKWTKVPVSACGKATGTDEAHRHTWVTQEEAARAARQRHYSGVGFVIPAGYFMLDIDHKDLDDPVVRKFLKRFSNTYAEISVSGHGVHVLGKCDLDRIPTYADQKGKRRLSRSYYQKNSKAGIELYIGGITGRFCTYTGKAVNDVPLTDCTEAILTTLEEDMRREAEPGSGTEQKAEKPHSGPIRAEEDPMPELTAEERKAEADDIIAALSMQKNGMKFIRLFEEGDISDYGSQSEAEMALCTLIAYRAGNDPALIDAVFRQSRLYRDKWEREDYREETIRKAILFCCGKFHPSAMKNPPFICFDEKRKKPFVAPALLAQYIRDTVPFFLVQNNSKQATMIFVFEDGCYRYFDKQMMLGKIKEPVEAYNLGMVSMPKILEAYNQLISDRKRVAQRELNADEHLINFENGILEVTSDRLILYPHSPEIRSTIQIPCAWNGEEADTPLFDQYLDSLTNGNQEIRQLLLEYIGLCISNVKGWRTKKSLFLVGPGDTGKSVLKSLVERILGNDNCQAIDLQEIEARFGTGMLYGIRLAGSSDMSYLSINELKTFKKLTGGDAIFAEFKGQQGFQFIFDGMLWFCMNRLPKFGGDDGKWVYDRIMIVHCENVIPKEEQDKTLLDKLYEERAGIICKAVRALQNVIRNGYRFTEPKCVAEARDDYQKENNTAVAFFAECMVERRNPNKDPYHRVTYVYDAYLDYCRKNGYRFPKKRIEFRDAIMEYLNLSDPQQLADHCSKGTCYLNYMMTEEAINEYGSLVA